MKSLSIGKTDIVILDIEHYTKYKNVIFYEILDNEYIFVMSKEYAKRNNVNIKELSDLNNYSLILPKESTTARKVLDKYLDNEKINFQYEMVSEKMRKDLATEGLGIAYVMKHLVKEELKTGELLEIKLDRTNNESEIGLATLKEEISSFATKRLVEYILKLNK